ncbi:hypothetical protein BAUCODRAFT_192725 [Baudoinia panamericana UAMH 10762]|uniref:Uncharacterized protein n=1 Tax=Baudoinia panamericana (strain UAMH 10762) TaxID=717646 RepID=M2NNF5_BAUPA|nr:uncharacterized protein BAUCODRAFT_192725 [Baudoinia panamericana UAMH 10762]EMD01020.1 hypothetical protein BAUCODRAFT_192725 [Baudoinia panamericana UAMH 10762]
MHSIATYLRHIRKEHFSVERQHALRLFTQRDTVQYVHNTAFSGNKLFFKPAFAPAPVGLAILQLLVHPSEPVIPRFNAAA